jgi:hypothetical protein
VKEYVVKPLGPETWEPFAKLVERHNGVFGGCWCTWFHTFHAEKTFTADGNRALKKRLVEEGRAHAALVFDGDEAIAWCQYGQPDELPNIHHRKQYEAELDRLPDYRITCIFVDKKHRREGVTATALRGAIDLICAGRRRGRRGIPARHRRQEGLRPLQQHTIPVRAGRLQLSPAQRAAELRHAHDRRPRRAITAPREASMKGIRHFMRDFTATAVREHLHSAVETGGQAPDLTKNELALVRFMCEGSFDWSAFLAERPNA